jgi:hypothetical protein
VHIHGVAIAIVGLVRVVRHVGRLRVGVAGVYGCEFAFGDEPLFTICGQSTCQREAAGEGRNEGGRQRQTLWYARGTSPFRSLLLAWR